MVRGKPVIGVGAGYILQKGKGKVGLPATYVDAVVKGGGVPLALPPTDDLDLVGEMLDRVDGALLTGGPDISAARYGQEQHEKANPLLPRREAFDLAVLAEADRRGMPTLAICLGIQVVNVGRGGTLIQDIPSQAPSEIKHAPAAGETWPEHLVEVAPDTLLSSIVGAGEFVVNSSHHQAVDRVGKGLVVSARASDGTIECVEDAGGRFFLGLQWHPERLTDRPRHLAIFEALVEAASRNDE